jgi:succinate dehydrogenase/fumarate reductase flavoprotein subunit
MQRPAIQTISIRQERMAWPHRDCRQTNRTGRCASTRRPLSPIPLLAALPSTFGGLKINANAQAIGTDWRPIPGLFTCGEMVGGLFHFNYPGGTGLVSGAVFGRSAAQA